MLVSVLEDANIALVSEDLNPDCEVSSPPLLSGLDALSLLGGSGEEPFVSGSKPSDSPMALDVGWWRSWGLESIARRPTRWDR